MMSAWQELGREGQRIVRSIRDKRQLLGLSVAEIVATAEKVIKQETWSPAEKAMAMAAWRRAGSYVRGACGPRGQVCLDARGELPAFLCKRHRKGGQ